MQKSISGSLCNQGATPIATTECSLLLVEHYIAHIICNSNHQFCERTQNKQTKFSGKRIYTPPFLFEYFPTLIFISDTQSVNFFFHTVKPPHAVAGRFLIPGSVCSRVVRSGVGHGHSDLHSPGFLSRFGISPKILFGRRSNIERLLASDLGKVTPLNGVRCGATPGPPSPSSAWSPIDVQGKCLFTTTIS